MHLNDFAFQLPEHLIAKYPAAKRSLSRLLHLDLHTGAIAHRQFFQLIDFILPGDLLVFNDTRVIPARLFGQKTTGGQVEVLIERVLDNQRVLAQLRVSKSPRVGERLLFPQNISLEILNRQNYFYELSYTESDRIILDIIEQIGHIPLPPYIDRKAEESDKERYQTVYAKYKGSVAAPTAGFHFDEALLKTLNEKIEFGYLTLHVGAGTFAPVRTSDIKDHKMHAEYIQVSPFLCEQIEATKTRGGRVIAIGTTSLRALEAASQTGKLSPYSGDTNIFIFPGYQFQCVDALVTNFHLPRSSLLMLVSAFAGHDKIMQAYQEAVALGYRFYSYGDAMFIGGAT